MNPNAVLTFFGKSRYRIQSKTKRLALFPWGEIALFALALGVYARTLAPGTLGGDAGELQFVPFILSLPHPTGTPLYVLLGKLWSLLPFGPTVAWRMNLLAALSAAAAVMMVYRIIIVAEHGVVPALGGALALAFAPTFWEQAIIADKYAFNALMVALVLGLALRWGTTHSPRDLNMLAFVYGLSLTHHRTMILFAPWLAAYIWIQAGRHLWRDKPRLLRLLGLLIAPLTLYLYLPWAASRGLPPGTWQPKTLGEWLAYLFDTGRTGLVYIEPISLGARLAFYWRTLWNDFGTVGIALGGLGLVTLWRRRRVDALLLTGSFALQAFLAANHHVPRHWVYFIPSFLIVALWVGEGMAALPAWVLARSNRVPWSTRIAAWLIMILILIWIFAPFPERYRTLREGHLGAGTLDPWRQTLKTGYMAERLGRALAEVAPQAVIVCDWEQATPLWYKQHVEGLRPDVQVIYPIERLDEALSGGRPVYLARAFPGIGPPWHPWAETPLIALLSAPRYDLPSTAMPIGKRYGDAIELAGVRMHPVLRSTAEHSYEPYPGEVLALTLYWRALAPPPFDYSVSVRLYAADGTIIGSTDSQHPVLGMSPTSGWITGQIIADYYELQIPFDAVPGELTWGALLYRSLPEGGWENLTPDGVAETSPFIGTITLQSRP